MKELKIIAVITVKEEYKDEVLKALHNVVDATRKEEGNIAYDLHQDVKNPLVYTFIEEWKSKEAIAIHNQTPHFSQFKEAIEGKVDSLTIDVIRKVY